MMSSYIALGRENPWITKVDPETRVYAPFTDDLGFDHIMDVLREAVLRDDPALDARPLSVTEALCWPQVLDAVPPQSEASVAAILRDCLTVHMMGGAHAKKFAQTAIDNSTLFGQVFNRIAFPAGACPAA